MQEKLNQEERKRHAIIVSQYEKDSDLDFSAFLKIAQSFVFKVRIYLKAASFLVATVSYK